VGGGYPLNKKIIKRPVKKSPQIDLEPKNEVRKRSAGGSLWGLPEKREAGEKRRLCNASSRHPQKQERKSPKRKWNWKMVTQPEKRGD